MDHAVTPHRRIRVSHIPGACVERAVHDGSTGSPRGHVVRQRPRSGGKKNCAGICSPGPVRCPLAQDISARHHFQWLSGIDERFGDRAIGPDRPESPAAAEFRLGLPDREFFPRPACAQ